jgi:hypothetical protein
MLPPATRALFGRIGVASPARFLHVVGLSSGLGRLEPDGTVGASRHGSLLVVEGTLTRTGVCDEVFRVADIWAGGVKRRRYDLVYTRFLLSRVPCPEQATAWMAGQLDAGGVLLVEDVQRGSESGLSDLLRTVGLDEVAVEVDPLPRTVHAWGVSTRRLATPTPRR